MTRPSTRQRTQLPGIYAALDRAKLLIATEVVVQGAVYGRADCSGCGQSGGEGQWLIDGHGAWCPRCGGKAFVPGALETGHLPFDNLLCLVGSDGAMIHAVIWREAQSVLCMPGALVGRMRPAPDATVPTCKRCIAAQADHAAAERSKAARLAMLQEDVTYR